ncbi:MAG: hypothetical protein E3J64_02240, partial [Anaerolineales bacterium]
MLIKLIADRFNTYFEQDPDHDTVLWFDPQREWEGLLSYLKPHLPLLIFEASQLHLRHQLVKRAAGERYVVYLPFQPIQSTERGEAEYLRPLAYSAMVFDDTLEAVLRDARVAFPEASSTMRELRPLLRPLAVASVGKGKAFWESVVNLETALARLIPDFEDLLLRLLAVPGRTVVEFEAQKIAGPILELFQRQFGVEPPARGEEEAWADRFTATLCLVDVYLAADKPDSFPFKGVLPAPVHWDRCCNFLRKWQRDEMFKEAFARRAKAIDGQYALAGWVQGLPHPPESSAFLNVERAAWDDVREELDAIADKSQAVAVCRAKKDFIRQHAGGYWAREGSLAGWAALARMTEVVIGADDALAELPDYLTAQALIGR